RSSPVKEMLILEQGCFWFRRTSRGTPQVREEALQCLQVPGRGKRAAGDVAIGQLHHFALRQALEFLGGCILKLDRESEHTNHMTADVNGNRDDVVQSIAATGKAR